MEETKKRVDRLERVVRDLDERVRRLEKAEKPKKLVGPTIAPM
jgi:hypothetical protein